MPTLRRLVLVVAVTAAAGYAAMLALATLVVPTPRNMIVAVPLEPDSGHLRQVDRDARAEHRAAAQSAYLETARRGQLANKLQGLSLSGQN